jgi:hypothetical protein
MQWGDFPAYVEQGEFVISLRGQLLIFDIQITFRYEEISSIFTVRSGFFSNSRRKYSTAFDTDIFPGIVVESAAPP